MSNNNAPGRKKDRVFRLVYGPAFQAEWSEKTWTDGLSKVVIKPNHGVVFVGFVAADGRARRGFLLPAEDAINLGISLQRNGALSKTMGDSK